ncbi:MAG: DUF120 domain-containing protein [Desulfurococcaceae archaeon TW002]
MLEGKVVTGFGVGAKYVSMPPYNIILTELIDEEPYPGTLNIEINKTYEELIKECTPSSIRSLIVGGVERGGFYYWFGKIPEIPNEWVLVIRPYLSKHKPNIIEIISGHNLREKLSLEDGKPINMKIYCADFIPL